MRRSVDTAFSTIGLYDVIEGGAENAGHENEGPNADMKMQHTGSSHVAVINSRH